MAVEFIQQATGSAVAGTTVTATLGVAPDPGDYLLLSVAVLPKTSTVSSVSGGGVTWSKLVSSAVNADAEVWVGPASNGTGTVITVTLGAAVTLASVNVSEWANVASASYTGPSASANGSLSNPATASVSANGGDVVLGMTAYTGVSSFTGGPSNSFIALSTPQALYHQSAYLVPTTDGSRSTGWTLVAALGAWDAEIVVLHQGDITIPDAWWGRNAFGIIPWGGATGELAALTVQTILGRARIQVVQNQTILGKARIQVTTNRTILGKADIQNTTTQTILGKARIGVTALKTILGLSRIQVVQTRTILGKADIQNFTVQTILGKAAVQNTTIRVTLGKANIIAQQNTNIRRTFTVLGEIRTKQVTKNARP